MGRSGASATVGGLWVGRVRREVARGIIGLVRVTSLLVGHRFAGWRTLMNGHSEFGSHVGRRLGTTHAILRLRPAWRRGLMICSTSGRRVRRQLAEGIAAFTYKSQVPMKHEDVLFDLRCAADG